MLEQTIALLLHNHQLHMYSHLNIKPNYTGHIFRFLSNTRKYIWYWGALTTNHLPNNSLAMTLAMADIVPLSNRCWIPCWDPANIFRISNASLTMFSTSSSSLLWRTENKIQIQRAVYKTNYQKKMYMWLSKTKIRVQKPALWSNGFYHIRKTLYIEINFLH